MAIPLPDFRNLVAAVLSHGLLAIFIRSPQETGGYSGLSLEYLAETFDLLWIYDAFYRHESASVHGAVASKSMNLKVDEDKATCSSFSTGPESVEEALKLASIVLLDVVQVASVRFGLRLEEQTSTLRVRVSEMKPEKRPVQDVVR